MENLSRKIQPMRKKESSRNAKEKITKDEEIYEHDYYKAGHSYGRSHRT